MTDSSSKLLQIQCKWYQERKQKKKQNLSKKNKNYSEPLLKWIDVLQVMQTSLSPKVQAVTMPGRGSCFCSQSAGCFRLVARYMMIHVFADHWSHGKAERFEVIFGWGMNMNELPARTQVPCTDWLVPHALAAAIWPCGHHAGVNQQLEPPTPLQLLWIAQISADDHFISLGGIHMFLEFPCFDNLNFVGIIHFLVCGF